MGHFKNICCTQHPLTTEQVPKRILPVSQICSESLNLGAHTPIHTPVTGAQCLCSQFIHLMNSHSHLLYFSLFMIIVIQNAYKPVCLGSNLSSPLFSGLALDRFRYRIFFYKIWIIIIPICISYLLICNKLSQNVAVKNYKHLFSHNFFLSAIQVQLT